MITTICQVVCLSVFFVAAVVAFIAACLLVEGRER